MDSENVLCDFFFLGEFITSSGNPIAFSHPILVVYTLGMVCCIRTSKTNRRAIVLPNKETSPKLVQNDLNIKSPNPVNVSLNFASFGSALVGFELVELTLISDRFPIQHLAAGI